MFKIDKYYDINSPIGPSTPKKQTATAKDLMNKRLISQVQNYIRGTQSPTHLNPHYFINNS